MATLDDLSRRFDEHAELDRDQLGAIRGKLEEHSECLACLRESTAATSATVSAIRDDLRHARKLELVRTEETAKITRVRTGGRYRLFVALVAAAGAAIAAGLGALAHYLS